ncbi:polyphosphate:AMP phosphotransferase [Roseofilum casamattae]|uniref:Polyphosphate:AMP phosphotransferase n=1 Tax=Roseofilum casamattae BLCC-M143 TaxID=3022442 RepID=A0ABT7BXC6_9CYAN|nr:polyphosphate:AMP phosphotransferase [Roseofilum casamattae]MDJ1183837.1 polyphosphate:AMP phosphotransferase [Roseofilum casamattae BLCC-M143]
MLEQLDLDRSLEKDRYKIEIEDLMRQLRSLQQACWEKNLPAIIVLEGWAAAGKGGLVKKVINYMDPRGFSLHPIWPPTAEEKDYPFLWRFWRKTPHYGKMGLFYHSWYTHVLEERLFERVSSAEVPGVMRHINAFERQMSDDGCAIAKFWIHISKKELKQRLKDYAKDPLDAWRVREEDWKQVKYYGKYRTLAEEMLIQTSTGFAPWTLVEGNCQRWARVKVLQTIAATLQEALDRQHLRVAPPSVPPQEALEPGEPDILARADLSAALSRDEYKQRLKEAQVRLRELQLKIFKHNIPVLALFEGWDAAGKGGAIKRLTNNLDPRSYEVTPFAAPTSEEKKHHYLWRFWQHLPPAGKIGIFDRTWYGRVFVERIEGFATDVQWRQAYREINEFESMLSDRGYVLVKFWLHISPEEQLRRFEDRKNDPFKQYKLTEEDWRNREQWGLYDVAVNQAISRTHTPNAPWTVVPGNDKLYARVTVLETVIGAIATELKKY